MQGKRKASDVILERAGTSARMLSSIQWLHAHLRAFSRRIACYRALGTARQLSLARLASGRPRHVLIVCYGNICRSAFVSAYFESFPVPNVYVRSAGVHPLSGRESPPGYVRICHSYGIDLRTHRSKTLTEQDLSWADVIVLMDRHNWHELTERAVRRDRLIWLGALDGGPIEIADPYKLDDAEAEEVVRRLSMCSKLLAELLTE